MSARRFVIPFVVLGCLLSASVTSAQFEVRQMCRVKGQEENELRGVGLVVGLDGTGDPDLGMTKQALARALVNTGIEMPRTLGGQELTDDFTTITNVALVFVTARVPTFGGRQGSELDCQVYAFGNAVSLEGGFLLSTAMTGGPATGESADLPVLAYAKGRIHVDARDVRTSGTIRGGCQLETDFQNRFYYLESELPPHRRNPNRDPNQMYIDLVVKDPHASFTSASTVADAINANGGKFGFDNQDDDVVQVMQGDEMAIALDQVTVQVMVPEWQLRDLVGFVRDVLEVDVVTTDHASKVVISERTGTILVGENVHFAPVAVSSGDFAIEAGPFVPLDLNDNEVLNGGPQQKLKDLVDTLNTLQAPSETIIDIIKKLESAGYLYGEVISDE